MGEKAWTPSFTELLDSIWGPTHRLNPERAGDAEGQDRGLTEAAAFPAGESEPETTAPSLPPADQLSVDALMKQIGEAVDPDRSAAAATNSSAPDPAPAAAGGAESADESALEADIEALMKEIGVAVDTRPVAANVGGEPALDGDFEALMAAIAEAAAPMRPLPSTSNLPVEKPSDPDDRPPAAGSEAAADIAAASPRG